MTTFAAALDFTDRLSLDEQEELARTLHRRVAEKRRGEIIAAVKESREEYAAGELKVRSVAEIMKLVKA
jgi:hypothetical protein